MTNYAIYGEYVSALSSGIVTSELREAAYDALRGAFLEESAAATEFGTKFNSSTASFTFFRVASLMLG